MTEVAEKDIIKLRLLRNPFDPTSFVEEELVYNGEFTLLDYMEGLPTPNAWKVGYNGLALGPKLWHAFSPEPGDTISLVRAPEGGGDGKQILRLVAVIAIAIIAPELAALAELGKIGTAVLTAAITVSGTLLVNALIPPPTPDLPSADFDSRESPSYGIDGPKNTSREGLPVPVVYGEYRVAGNIIDLYTQNVNDTQYLYMRTALNDGEVESITDIEVNDQPLDNFVDVQSRTRLGEETQLANDWFNEAVRLINRGAKLSTDWITHTTTSDVDRLRLDFVAPQGMVEFDEQGKKTSRSVDLEIQFKPTGSATWNVLQVQNIPTYSNGAFFGGFGQGRLNTQIAVRADESEIAAGSMYYNQASAIEYRASGGSWTSLPPTNTVGRGIQQPAWGIETPSVTAPGAIHTYNLDLPEGDYEVRTTDGSTIVETRTEFEAGSTIYQIRGSSTKAQRKTLESVILPRDTYDVRVRRTTAESTESTIVDAVYISDIGEIDTSPVQMNGVANNSLRIKVSDQINSRPKLTALVKGCLLKEYDRDGNFVVEQWSANPAWQLIDLLTNTLRGAAMDLSRFDMDMFVEWAEFCIAEGIEFNGVFDYESNVWDAAQLILRVGRAQLVRLGTKWSIAIDRAADPVMIFNDANIIQGSMSTTWLPLAERANEIQLSYADRNDGFRRKTIRLVDDTVSTNGERTNVASYSEQGITLASKAAEEAEYQLRRNKLLQKAITFETPLEAIALTLGDVAEVHTIAGDFAGGMSGKAAAGSTTTTVELDRAVTIENGQSYRLLVYQDAVKLHDATIDQISGNTIRVTGISAIADYSNVERLVQGDVDVQVGRFYDSNGDLYFIVDDYFGLATGAVELWDTNVIEERDITTTEGEHFTVELSAALSKAPSQYASWIFGRVTEVRQQYRLVGMDAASIHNRELSFIEYNSDLYLPAGTVIPDPEFVGPSTPEHVRDLSIDYDKFITGDELIQNVLVTWNKPDTINYGGADVYVDEGTGEFRLYTTVLDATQAQLIVADARNIRIRVVGFDKLGRRANFFTAPILDFDTAFYFRDLAAPTNIAASAEGYDISGTVRVYWDAPVDETVTQYRVDTRKLSQTDYDAIIADPTLGEPQSDWTQTQIDAWDAYFENPQTTPDTEILLPNLKSGYFQFRVRAERGRSVSDWEVLTYHLDAPEFLNFITGLRTVDGGITFGGRDCELIWDDIFANATAEDKEDLPYILQDYQVEILTTGDALLRTEIVQQPRYIYSYDKNSEDASPSRARRTFKVRVTARGRQGQTSQSQELTFSNPPPVIVGSPTINGLDVTLPIPIDSDFLGYRVWTKTTNDINTATDPYTDLKQNSFRIPAATGQTVYFVYAPIDEFDDTTFNISPVYSVDGDSGDNLGPILDRLNDAEADIDNAEADIDEIYNATILGEGFPGFAIVGGHGSIELEANVPSASDISISEGYFDHPYLERIDVPTTVFSTAFGVQFAPPEEWFVVVYSAQDVASRFSNGAGAGNFFPATYDATTATWYAWGTSMGTAEAFVPINTDVVIAKAIKTLAPGETQQSDVNGIIELIEYVRDTNVVNSRLDEVSAEVDTKASQASVESLEWALAGFQEAVAVYETQVNARFIDNEADISSAQRSIADLDSALASFTQTVTSTFATKASVASVNDVRNSLATLNEALARFELEVGAQLADKASVAELTTLGNSLANLTTAFSQLETNLYSALNQRATVAELNEVRSTLATATQSIAQLELTISSTFPTLATQADINEIQQTIADLEGAQATIERNLSAQIASRASQADLQTVAAALAASDHALGIYQNEVTARFQSVEGAVTQTASVVAGINGRLASTWGIKLNSNGHVSGIYGLNDGRRASFVFDADELYLGRPGSGGIRPFQIVGDTVRMSNVEVDNIRARSITTDHLAGAAVTDAIASVKNSANPISPDDQFEFQDQIVYYSETGGTIRFEYQLYLDVGTGAGDKVGIAVKMQDNGRQLTPRDQWHLLERGFPHTISGSVIVANASAGWHTLRLDVMVSNGSGTASGATVSSSELFMQVYKDDR